MANPVATDDAFSINEDGTVSGSLFADNGGGADTDPDSDPFVVTSVDGSAANVGAQIVLASGALLTVNADGSLSYDPNGAFDHLPAPGSGSPFTGTDTFTYEITDGDMATVTITLTGLDSDADLLVGTAAAQNFNGGAGANDTVTYAGSTAAVDVNLSLSRSASGGFAQGDRFRDIENLIGSPFNDVLSGNTSSAADNYIHGGDGDDTILDLSTGTNTLRGDAGNDAITSSSGIDLIDGGTGNDTINSGANDDNIQGGDGDDVVNGGNGADTMDGGAGVDTLLYGGLSGVIVDLATGVASGAGATGDVITSFENVRGSVATDVLSGDASTNLLDGSSGDDLLDGGGGADQLLGGGGIDTATYASSGTGVGVNLTTNAGSGGSALGDTFDSIENLTGSNFADLLYGNSIDNRLDGGDGDDQFVGGLGGDAFVGGAGVDEVFYANSNTGVIANIEANTAGGGHATGDTFEGIEDLFGSRYADELYGDAGGNKFDGWQGNDVLSGGDGDDWLIGGLGNDDLIGGEGGDVLAGGFGNDNLNGGAGDDVMVGYGGLDLFIYMDDQFGNDVVMGFQNDFDKFDLTGSGLTFASFTETAAGPGTRLTWFDGAAFHSILIIGVAPALIDASDFAW